MGSNSNRDKPISLITIIAGLSVALRVTTVLGIVAVSEQWERMIGLAYVFKTKMHVRLFCGTTFIFRC